MELQRTMRRDMELNSAEGISPCRTRIDGLPEDFLRPYQRECLERAISAPAGRGILSVPTGGGKTRIAGALVACVGGKWLYVVHGKDLARQAVAAFASMEDTLEQFTDGLSIHVCGWGEAAKMIGEEFQGIVFDEVHGIAAVGRSTTAAQLAGRWRIGISATPLGRCDNMNDLVIALTGPVLHAIANAQLVDDGWVSQCTVELLG